MKHPIQPVVKDDRGVERFKENAIVRYLFDSGACNMNVLARLPFDREDREQFAQLIGYSLSGAGDLSYMSDETLSAAEIMSTKVEGPLINAYFDGVQNGVKLWDLWSGVMTLEAALEEVEKLRKQALGEEGRDA